MFNGLLYTHSHYSSTGKCLPIQKSGFKQTMLQYHVHQAQILNGDAGLLQGSRNSVVRASTAKVGGLGFDSQWLPKFFPSVCFYSDLPPVAYQQFLLPVVVIRIVIKIVM